MTPLAELIKNTSTLENISLHWNNIRGVGAYQICQSFSYNDSLRVIDLSFNSIARPADNGAIDSLAKAFKFNKSIYHVDLSHNRLTTDDVENLAMGLKNNVII